MNLIDRYIIKQFINTLIFSIIALYVIFLVVSMLENLDKFLDAGVSTGIIVQYYLYYFPEILKLLTPVAMLLATLFSVGKLASLNEITAMRTGGLSLYRLMLPLLLLSITLSFGQLYFNGWIVPKAIEKKLFIEQKYLKKSNDAGGPIYNLYLRDSPNSNLNMQYYNADTKLGNKIGIEYFTNNITPRMNKRISAETLTWDSLNMKWKLIDGFVRNYDVTNRQKVMIEKFDTLEIALNLKHDQIKQMKKTIAEMNYNEVFNYLQTLKQGGREVTKEMTSFYGDFAYPFANFIVVLFVVPFASVRKKGGVAVQIAAALIIAFAYLIFTKVSQTIGTSISLSPELSGWGANIIFFVGGLINLLRSKA